MGKRVKIIATIGPKTATKAILTSLHAEGMDIIRLNGSHANDEWLKTTTSLIRSCLPDTPILLDIPGRKIRVGDLPAPVRLYDDDKITFSIKPGIPEKVYIKNFTGIQDLRVGECVTVDDSSVRLQIIEVRDGLIICNTVVGGIIESRKGIHFPSTSFSKSSALLSERDYYLLNFTITNHLDYVGISFIESKEDIEQIRTFFGTQGPKIISKIETSEAIKNLDGIVRISDAIMIDRGDLAAETKNELLPIYQKNIIKIAEKHSVPVIIATDMLNSMITQSCPTKAEICDIANAVMDGATALMLSGETAIGDYPIEAVRLMRTMADSIAEYEHSQMDNNKNTSIPNVMGEAIAHISQHLNITKIIAISKSGYAARMISTKKPKQPIISVTNDPVIARQQNLYYNVRGICYDISFSRNSLDHVPLFLKELWDNGEIIDTDLIVVTAVGYPRSGNRMNLVEIHNVSDLKETLGWQKKLSF